MPELARPTILPSDHQYVKGLDQNEANHVALSPLSFLARAALVYPDKMAVVHGKLTQNWLQTYTRCKQLASAIQSYGLGLGDTVAVM